MFNLKNKSVPTPPHSDKTLKFLCHSELVSESQDFKKSAGLPRFARNDGFTLAEVLITLVIIGVIAAITVPTLIAKYQKEQTVTRLKKVYSELSQAINKSIISNGYISTWDLSGIDVNQKTIHFAENYLFPHMNVIKKCYPSNNECWADNVFLINGTVDSFYSNSRATHSSAILADGICLYMWTAGNATHTSIIADINCQNKPNKFGRDIFSFQVFFVDTETQKSGFRPYGLNDRNITRDEIKEKCFETGEYCSGLIAIDGWKIPDNYPW